MPVRFLFLGCLVPLLWACPKKGIVREAETYKSEMAWFAVCFEEASAALREAAVAALEAGDRDTCLEYAELSLVIGIRGPHHADKALHLAELGDDPGEEPEVPEPATICDGGE
jgi:hypothetical protein